MKMNIKRISLLLVVSGAILLIGLIYLALKKTDLAPAEVAVATSPPTNIQKSPSPAPAAPQTTIIPLELRQNGIYSIDYINHPSAALSIQYPFIAEALKVEEDPYSPGDMLSPELPQRINISEIKIPSKQLTLAIVYADDSNFCSGTYCLLNLYVKRPNGYENYLGLMATKNSYVMVSDKSVSIITCESAAGYNEWRLGDGTLDGPIPPNSPGHFVPVGTFKHDKVAPCP